MASGNIVTDLVYRTEYSFCAAQFCQSNYILTTYYLSKIVKYILPRAPTGVILNNERNNEVIYFLFIKHILFHINVKNLMSKKWKKVK